VLHEGFDFRIPEIADRPAALGVIVEVSKERVGKPILGVIGHGGCAGETVRAPVAGPAPRTPLPFAGLLVVKTGFDVGLTHNLTQRVVEAVDVVPVGVGALSAATWGEARFVRLLSTPKGEVGHGGLIKNAAFSKSRRFLFVDVAG